MEKESARARISGTIQAPSSKSYAQRAVAAALLAEGRSTLLNVDMCSDTRSAIEVARALGARAEQTGPTTYVIAGGIRGGRLSPAGTTIDIGESGLSTRMFTPIASLCSVPITITGHGSILGRPMEMMTGPLVDLGVDIKSNNGLLPITVRGPIRGGETVIDGSSSSQFLTGLLMALPLGGESSTLHVSNPVSLPYIDMTLRLLEDFGIGIDRSGYTQYRIPGRQSYRPRSYNIEGDWSGASCMLVAGAIAGEVTVTNLDRRSIQADVAMVNALTEAGAEVTAVDDTVTVRRRSLRGFRFDATHCPDLFPALVALAANCEGVSTIRGTGRLSHKESDRAQTLREEFGKMGVEVDISQEDVMYVKGAEIKSARVSSHNDHRIAMAAAVAALGSGGRVIIEDAGAVNKSYPGFWEDLDSLKH